MPWVSFLGRLRALGRGHGLLQSPGLFGILAINLNGQWQLPKH